MKITKLKIDGFGKFVDFDMSLHSGLNVIYGPNESGKTTLSDFMAFTISGFEAIEVERYRPWSGDELGGSLVLEKGDGEKVELLLDPSNPSMERFLKRREFELSSYVPEESGLNVIEGVDGIVLAKLKKRMEEMEEIERVVEILGKSQNLYERLAGREEEISKRMKELQGEIEELERRISEEMSLRKRYVENKKRLEVLEREIENLEKDLLAVRIVEAKNLWKEMDEIRIEISNLGVEISKYKRYTKVDTSLLSKVYDLERDLNDLNRRLEDLEKEMKKLEEEEEKLEDDLSKIGERLKIETEEDADRITLKVKNLELVHRMYMEKVSAVGGFKDAWEVFKDEERIENKIRRIEEIVNTMGDMESELERYGLEMARIEDEMKSISKSLSFRNTLSWITLGGAGALSVISFLLKNLWYGVGSGALAGLTLAIFVSSLGMRKRRENLEDDLTRYELNSRVLQRKIENLKEELKKELAQMGFESVEEFRKEYSEYLKWKERFRRHISSEEVRSLEEELRKGLSEFFGEVLGDYGRMISELRSMVEDYIKILEKLKMVRLSKEATRSRMEDLERARKALESELGDLFEKLECAEVENCSEIEEGLRKYEELVEKRKRMEEKLKEKKNKWESIKEYFDMEIPEGVDVESLETEEVIKTKIENAKLEKGEMEKKLLELMSKIKEVEVKPEDYYSKLEERSRLEVELAKATAEVRIYPEVLTVLSEIKDEFIGKYRDVFQERFLEILRRIRGEDLVVKVREDLSLEIFHSHESMSRAVKDQIELAYRIALHDALSPDDPYPLIIDNALVRYDDERLKNTLEFLKELSKERQVILTTSDSRILALVPKKSVKTLEKTT